MSCLSQGLCNPGHESLEGSRRCHEAGKKKKIRVPQGCRESNPAPVQCQLRHWGAGRAQVMMAKGIATGYLQWGDERLEFEGAPAYAEKNWGGGFPKRWFWIQCEDFVDSPSTALTSVGAWEALSGCRGRVQYSHCQCVGYRAGRQYSARLRCGKGLKQERGA